MPGSTNPDSTSMPSAAAPAKLIAFTVSCTTETMPFAACICFCAIRPAKSSSKKLTDWPSVCRFSRDITCPKRFGITAIDWNPPASPNDSGRSTSSTRIAVTARPRLSAQNPAPGPAAVASITLPSSHIVTDSSRPPTANRTVARITGGHDPFSAHRKNRPSVLGGGPSASRR